MPSISVKLRNILHNKWINQLTQDQPQEENNLIQQPINGFYFYQKNSIG